MPYISGSTQSVQQVQYDADPREMGSFAAPENVGKTALFRVGDTDSRDISFKVPPANQALNDVLAACGVAPYTASEDLAPKYAAALVVATQAVQADRKTGDHKIEQIEVLKEIVVTKPEWVAYQDLLRFDFVATAENVKAKGLAVPPRRKRCADAFVAQFKAGKYKGLPAACAYVEKEAGE